METKKFSIPSIDYPFTHESTFLLYEENGGYVVHGTTCGDVESFKNITDATNYLEKRIYKRLLDIIKESTEILKKAEKEYKILCKKGIKGFEL